MKQLQLDNRLYHYLLSHGVREPMILKLLREETEKHPDSRMMTPPEQAQFLVWLAQLTGALRILEIGTFTGYMTLWFALHLPDGGQVITCDLEDQAAGIGRNYWKQAGMLNRIDFRLGPAHDTLLALGKEGQAFSLVYIDADKVGMEDYLEAAYPLLEPNGILCLDNVLWGGKVADPGIGDPDTNAIREVNRKLYKDPRFSTSLLPVGDGIHLCRKKG